MSDDGSNEGSGSGDPEKQPQQPRWKVFAYNAFVIAMAIASIVAAREAYRKIKNAASDVDAIVKNWQTKPIADYKFVAANAECDTGYEAVALPEWPGIPESACGCQDGATYLLKGGKTKAALSSTAAACLTNQTSHSDYKCRTVGEVSKFENTLWREKNLCIKRGFTAAVDTPYPDDAGKCPTGFHKCGGDKGFDSTRGFCATDDEGVTACPITWMGSTNTLDTYFPGGASTDVKNALNAGSTCTDTCAPYAFTDGSNQKWYEQAASGDKNVVTFPGKWVGPWSPLPMVELVGAFQMSGVQGPCYGKKDESTRADSYKSVGFSDDGSVQTSYPDKCKEADTRFMPVNTNEGKKMFDENAAVYSVCGSTSTQYDFFQTAQKCSSNGDLPSSCLSGAPETGADCGSDKICQLAFWQTKCGAVQSNKFDSTSSVGYYQKSQVYWSEACPYKYERVVKNNGPLQKAIDWQTGLFYLNMIVNAILILLSLYICYIAYANAGTDSTMYISLEETWKPRAEFFGNWIKVPVIIVTIVFTSAVSKFFVSLSKEQCSDSFSNSTFDELGKSLPAVVTSNAIVLVVDLLGLLPVLYKKCCGGGDEEVGDVKAVATDEIEGDLEMASATVVQDASVAARVEDGDKVITYADGVEVVGGEGKIVFSDGGVYNGFIFKRNRHNQGTMQYADGHVYKGQWKEDMRDGTGKLTDSNGNTEYHGEWFQDNRSH